MPGGYNACGEPARQFPVVADQAAQAHEGTHDLHVHLRIV